MPKTRIPINQTLSADVLFASDRTCCVCRERGKRVQIHHIDDDPSNNVFENLSVLCLACHDDTQVRGGFAKHLTAPVVKKYRDEWIGRVEKRRTEADAFAVSKMVGGNVVKNKRRSEPVPVTDIYSYLDTLPLIKCDLMSKSQAGWDSGVTAKMNQASYDYTDGLQGILVGLSAFYSPDAFDGQDPQEFFSEVISSRYRWHRAHAEPHGPGTGGTIVGTMCGGSVSADVEKMIEDMVMSLIGWSDEYSWKRWKRLWDNKAT